MKKVSSIILSKPFCIGMLICGFVYGLVLPWGWGNDPFDQYGTLSILCEDRKIFFWLWVLLVCGSCLLNTLYAYRKYKDNSKALRVIAFAAMAACICIALTLKHDVHSWNPKRIAHWIATGVYIAGVGLSLFVFVLKNVKRVRGFWLIAVLTLLLVASIVVWLLTLGKSAMMEAIPYAALQILLFIINFTPAFRLKETE